MRKSRKFISMPIISIEEGQQIGTVKSIVLDPERKEVAALIIEQRGWFKDQKVIPYNKIHSVGGDAITVEKYTNAEKQTNLPHIVKLIKDKYEIIGSKVVAENGTVLGYIDEFYVDLINGKITTLEISGRFLDGLLQGKATLDTEYIKTIGKEVLIAVEGAENYLKQIEVGLKGTLNNLKTTSSNLWDSTIQKTKSVTKTINQSFEKKKPQKTSETPEEVNIINLDNQSDFVERPFEEADISRDEDTEEGSENQIETETNEIETETGNTDNIVDITTRVGAVDETNLNQSNAAETKDTEEIPFAVTTSNLDESEDTAEENKIN